MPDTATYPFHFDLSPSPPIYMGRPPMRGDCVSHNRSCASHLPGLRVPKSRLRVTVARTACPITGTVRPICQGC
eukprot:474851-Pyramimonas_sp.AAC.1